MAIESGFLSEYALQKPELPLPLYGEDRLPSFQDSLVELGRRFVSLCETGGIFIPESLLFIPGRYAQLLVGEGSEFLVRAFNKREAPTILKGVLRQSGSRIGIENQEDSTRFLNAVSGKAMYMFCPNMLPEQVSENLSHNAMGISKLILRDGSKLEPREMLAVAVNEMRKAYGLPRQLELVPSITSPFYGMEMQLRLYYFSDQEVVVNKVPHHGMLDWVLHGILAEGLGVSRVEDVLREGEEKRSRTRLYARSPQEGNTIAADQVWARIARGQIEGEEQN